MDMETWVLCGRFGKDVSRIQESQEELREELVEGAMRSISTGRLYLTASRGTDNRLQ